MLLSCSVKNIKKGNQKASHVTASVTSVTSNGDRTDWFLGLVFKWVETGLRKWL
jgi:hypothetical protein